jgi:hypothetical protein
MRRSMTRWIALTDSLCTCPATKITPLPFAVTNPAMSSLHILTRACTYVRYHMEDPQDGSFSRSSKKGWGLGGYGLIKMLIRLKGKFQQYE